MLLIKSLIIGIIALRGVYECLIFFLKSEWLFFSEYAFLQSSYIFIISCYAIYLSWLFESSIFIHSCQRSCVTVCIQSCPLLSPNPQPPATTSTKSILHFWRTVILSVLEKNWQWMNNFFPCVNPSNFMYFICGICAKEFQNYYPFDFVVVGYPPLMDNVHCKAKDSNRNSVS